MLRKFAAFEVLEATLAPEGGSALRAYAHRHSFTYEPRPGYLYVRSRAISSRTNDNFDTFPADEIKKSYLSFIGKPVFVNHNNDNHRRARGVIIDAALHEDTNPDGTPDTWSEVLMEVDAVRFPKLAQAILAGHIDRTSMGTDVAFSKCSFCGNKATTPLEYCQHIPKMKGKRIYRTTASGKKEGVLVSEICHGLKFFENSLLVEEPADPTAFFTGVDDHSGVGKTASKVQAGAGGHAKQPFIEGHWTEHDTKPREDGSYRASCQCGYVGEPRDNHIDAYADKLEHGGTKNPDFNLERVQERMLQAQNPAPLVPKTPAQRQREADHEQHTRSWSGTNPANWALASVEVPEYVVTAAKGLGVYLSKERKKVSEMSPAEEQAFRKHQDSGRRWNKQNPAHADNIIAHWNAATPHERHSGMNWYADAHETTKHIANDTKTPMHVAAGLMSNYSPQTHWATNMLNAAKAMRGKKGIGGKGSGIFATESQKSRAQKLMGTKADHSDATHYDHVLDGPKTHAFAHLIHHGGNADPSNPKVVVDRHALSVACGSRAKDIDYEMSGLGGKKRYKQVADEYHKAAKHISKHTGVKVEAHQVQAATWLARQRLNAGEDAKMASYGKVSNDATHEWNQYAGEHHPQAMGKEPGTGYSAPKDAPEDVVHAHEMAAEGTHGSLHAAVPPTNPQRKDRTGFGRSASNVYLAYGETKAPEDVDTLRDEECPVCGENDAYDGNRCDVCGFDAPPKMFQDPDLDMAKQLDLRKDMQQDIEADPNGDGMPDVIPGSGQMGPDAIPPGAEQIPDPDDVAQQQMNEISENQAPLDPNALDENGQPLLDAADPMAQALPQDPNAAPMDPTDIAGAAPMDEYGQTEPGTPGDGVPDLVCPACGYSEDGNQPTSTDMDSSTPNVEGQNALCPQCQQAPLQSAKDMQEQMGQIPVSVRSMLDRAFPVLS